MGFRRFFGASTDAEHNQRLNAEARRRRDAKRLGWAGGPRSLSPSVSEEQGGSSEPADYSVDAVLDELFPEVDHECQFEIEQPKIGECLRLENRVVGRSCLAFDEDLALNKQVQSELCVQHVSFVDERDRLLTFHEQPSLSKFETESFHIDAFQQPGSPEHAVHFDGGSDHGRADLIFGNGRFPFRSAQVAGPSIQDRRMR